MSHVLRPAYALAIHGGAGVVDRSSLTLDREEAYRAGLAKALAAGLAILERGGPALDAVEASVVALEDDPLFNAGRGATLTAEGRAELDAAIMDGATLRAGAAAQLRRIKNPVRLARWVMEASPHVFLVGEGAEAFAKKQGLEFVEETYFVTDYRRKHLEEVLAAARGNGGFGTQGQPQSIPTEEPSKGTVGAVALDKAGNLAAATSTGGMTAKASGRVGDSPVIGAGTYADNATCAISCTGHGEWFIRMAVAHDVAARIGYRGDPLEKAAAEAIGRLKSLGAAGGLIAVDARGNLALPFNTNGMYRAWVRAGEPTQIGIF